MTESFDVASAVQRLDAGRWQARIPAGWRQGAGAFGGLGCAVLLRAMAEAAGGRPARTLAAQFCAPVLEGEHGVEVTLERQGTGMSFASARLVAGDRVVLHAMATFGTDRSERLDLEAAPPGDLPPPSACPVAETPFPPFPEFLQQFEVRVVSGSFPGGGAQRRIGAWIRPKHPVPLSPGLAVAFLDAMPPVALTRSPRPQGMASVALHANLLAALPDSDLDPAAHAYVEVRSAATRGGYSEQSARLYGPGGRLLATVSQLFAVL